MVNILKERNSVLLVVKKIQIKATVRFCYTSIRWFKKILKSGSTRYWLGWRTLSLFLFIYLFTLGYSCFTMLCWFLLYNEVNELHVYTHPLPLGSPSHPSPTPPI